MKIIALLCAASMLASLPVFAEPAAIADEPAEEAVSDEASEPASEPEAADPAEPAESAAGEEVSDAGETGETGADPEAEKPDDDPTAAEDAGQAAADETGSVDEVDEAGAEASENAELPDEETADEEPLTEDMWDMPLNGDGGDFYVFDDPSQPRYVLVCHVISESAKTVSVNISINPSYSNVAVTIPKTVKNDSTTYTVIAMTTDDHSTGCTIDDSSFQRIKSISFPDTMRAIPGNLFRWKIERNARESEFGLTTWNSPEWGLYVPVTADVVKGIPAFISSNYKDGCYYAGKCLVRVDPNYSGDLKVKAGTICILASALQGCSKIKKVTLPDSVEYIGMYAFADSSVTSVNLPKKLKVDTSETSWGQGHAIQYGTFYGCSKLKTVTVQCSTLGSLSQASFFGCKSLTGFDFSKVAQIDGWAFAGAFANGTKLTIPNSVYMRYGQAGCQFLGAGISEVSIDTAGISTKAFAGCLNLTKVTLGQNVRDIGTYSFLDCVSLSNDVLKGTKVDAVRHMSLTNTAMTELTIPATVNWIDGGSFKYNGKLKTVNWYPTPDNLQYSGFCPLFAMLNEGSTNCSSPSSNYASVFNRHFSGGNTNITTVNMYGGVGLEPNQGGFLQMIPTLETVNIKCEAEALPRQFCYGDINLKTVTLAKPASLKSVGEHAFSLTGLEEATILKGVTYGPYAFQGDLYLKKVVAEEGAEELGNFMFEGCAALEDVSLPETLKTVNLAAFKNAGNKASIYLPSALEVVEDDAFASVDGKDHGLSVIMMGDPQIETVHSAEDLPPYPDPENDKVAIPPEVTMVYTSSGPNYQVYKTYLSTVSSSAPAESPVPSDKAEVTYSGGIIEVGGSVDPSKVTVKVNGEVLPSSAYKITNGTKLTKTGITKVGVELNADAGSGSFLSSRTISAVLLDTAAKKGPVYKVSEGEDLTFDVQVSRFVSVSGKNRYATAAEIAKRAFPTGPSEAVLVTGENFPDALSANAYAGAKNAPVLMSKLTELPQQTKDLLTKSWKKSVKTVTIIGGGFDKKVETALKDCGVTTIKHIAGKNRYKTAEAVCNAGFKEGLWMTGVPIAVATGQTSADALAFSPWSYGAQVPILLVKDGEASASTKALIAKFDYAFLLGSSTTVKDSCLSAKQKANKSYMRMAGSNRYKTSLAIADYFISVGMGSYSNAAFADGTDEHFPDALVGGMLQGQLDAPIILTKPGQKDVQALAKGVMNEYRYLKDPVYFLGWSAKGKSSEYAELTKLLKE